jgi:hypothetical protein
LRVRGVFAVLMLVIMAVAGTATLVLMLYLLGVIG